MFLISSETAHIEIWLRENYSVIVATLHRSKDAKTLKVMSYGNIVVKICQDFCFIVQGICLLLTTAQAENIAIALAITFVRAS